MVKVIIVSTEGGIKTLSHILRRIERRLPQLTREGMRNWGKKLERDMKVSARNSGISPGVGNVLFTSGIRWEQGTKSNEGYLFMRLHAIYLDSMRPHHVAVKLSRARLLAWAKVARSSRIRRGARMVERRAKKGNKLKKFAIYVKPHPFISKGWSRSRPKLNPILRTQLSRAINK